MSGLPQIETLEIIDAEGKRINHSREWPNQSIDLAYRDYFQALKRNPKITSFVSDPMRGTASGVWAIAIVRPVLTADDRLLGVVFGSMTLKYYETIFSSTSLGSGYAATLVRSDGMLLTRYPATAVIGSIAQASILKTLINSRFGVSRSVSAVDGQARITAAYRLLNYPLVVVVSRDEENAFADWRKTALAMCVGAAAMIFIIVIASFLIAHSWKQQERLNSARAQVIESDKIRALAEAELGPQRDIMLQNTRFHAAVNNMSQGLCMFDADARLVVCNNLYINMYKLPPELVKPGTPRSDIIAYCVRSGILKGDQVGDTIQQQLSNSAPSTDKGWVRIDEHADGKLIRITREPMDRGGWVATHQDITEQRRADQELDETKRFLDSIIANIPIAIVVKEAKTRKVVLTNRAFEAMLGLPQSALIGKTAFDIYASGDAELMDKFDRDSLEQSAGIHYNDYEVVTPLLGLRIVATKRIVVRDAQGDAKYLIVVIEDITERKKSEQRIAFMAHHDALTGLYNRATIAQKIEEAAARQRRSGDPFAVLLLDLDRFKYVNDTLGHAAGDALLRQTATRLKALLRETDVIARLGGDEFAIIQVGVIDPRQAAGKLADRIIELFTKPFGLEGNEVNISTSIGIALAPEHATSPDGLLKMADIALYRAKLAGRNDYCVFDPQMSEAANARHELESDLRRAIQQDELELHYQPIIDTKTRKICGAEALVRWRHPIKGMIAPDRFIPLAEETGMITQIGEWVLHTACVEAATWPAGIKVAVNLSAVQFRKTNLSDVVMYALAQSGLPPERLELEITETALIESAAECLLTLRQFKNLGISIALDDFGTGYSSLSQLTMFCFDKIKIDKSFTQNLTKRAECAAIISAALTLAQSLSIATTAEGVETKDQYRLLRLAGVTSMQGYLFKRPGPSLELDFAMVYGGPEMEDAA
jgi:diguanylate cyclase (GGDEF)-like protein/PAS domain S-box-containing protein